MTRKFDFNAFSKPVDTNGRVASQTSLKIDSGAFYGHSGSEVESEKSAIAEAKREAELWRRIRDLEEQNRTLELRNAMARPRARGMAYWQSPGHSNSLMMEFKTWQSMTDQEQREMTRNRKGE